MPPPLTKNVKKFASTLKLFSDNPIAIKYLGGHNHHNYLIKNTNNSYLFRLQSKNPTTSHLLDVESEFSLLRLLAKYQVAPKPIYYGNDYYYQQKYLIEEVIEGITLNSLRRLNAKHLDALLDAIFKIETIKISPQLLKFCFRYDSYQPAIRNWQKRLAEIKSAGRPKKIITALLAEFIPLIQAGSKTLKKYESRLAVSKIKFIYCDIHGGNSLWNDETKTIRFIDWQKVGYGDPAFMPVLILLRFLSNHRPGYVKKFGQKIITKYQKHSKINNFSTLFWLRYLEREISDMIWVVWSKVKNHENLDIKNPTQYERIGWVKSALKDINTNL